MTHSLLDRHVFRQMGLDATTPRTMQTQLQYRARVINHAHAEGDTSVLELRP